MVGIQRGFAGLMEKDAIELGVSSVSGIIHQGGTILRTARSELFKTKKGQKRAFDNIKKLDAEGLIVIVVLPAPVTLASPAGIVSNKASSDVLLIVISPFSVYAIPGIIALSDS